MIEPRTFTNRPGVTFDASKTQILFAEDVNDINANIDEVAGDVADIVVPVKATGAEINTGTNDTKFATPKAIADSSIPVTLDKVENHLFGLGSVSLANSKFVRIWGSNLSAGDNDLYTVPANRKCLLFKGSKQYNQSAGNISWYTELKISGVYYRMKANDILATLISSSVAGLVEFIVLNAGESISVNVATNNGLNIWMQGIEFDSTETKIGTSRVLEMANGNNTLYTVPAGKCAMSLSGILGSSMGVAFCNNSGSLYAYGFYNVPSGGAAGATNLAQIPANLSDKAQQIWYLYSTLDAGDSIVATTNNGAAHQICYMTYVEIPNS